MIGGSIEVEILGVQPDGTVRVGVTAPRDILIDREEVRERLKNCPRQRRDGRDEITYDQSLKSKKTEGSRLSF